MVSFTLQRLSKQMKMICPVYICKILNTLYNFLIQISNIQLSKESHFIYISCKKFANSMPIFYLEIIML